MQKGDFICAHNSSKLEGKVWPPWAAWPQTVPLAALLLPFGSALFASSTDFKIKWKTMWKLENNNHQVDYQVSGVERDDSRSYELRRVSMFNMQWKLLDTWGRFVDNILRTQKLPSPGLTLQAVPCFRASEEGCLATAHTPCQRRQATMLDLSSNTLGIVSPVGPSLFHPRYLYPVDDVPNIVLSS